MDSNSIILIHISWFSMFYLTTILVSFRVILHDSTSFLLFQFLSFGFFFIWHIIVFQHHNTLCEFFNFSVVFFFQNFFSYLIFEANFSMNQADKIDTKWNFTYFLVLHNISQIHFPYSSQIVIFLNSKNSIRECL